MNRRQLLILWVTGAFVILACLIPPWEYTFQSRVVSQSTKPAGYYPIFEPPEPEKPSLMFGVRIDYGRLGAELLILSVVGGLGVISLRRKEPSEK